MEDIEEEKGIEENIQRLKERIASLERGRSWYIRAGLMICLIDLLCRCTKDFMRAPL